MTSLHRLDCGRLRGAAAMFEVGAAGEVTLPVSAWLVRHARGTVLFDAGMPRAFIDGDERSDRVAQVLAIDFAEGDALDLQLQAADQDPGRVDFAAISHLHFDHVGGLSMVPNATLVIQRAEWKAGMAVAADARMFHARSDYDLGHPLRLIDGEHDLFGDGSIVCLPTPGHTIGHQSLRVRVASGTSYVLTADCCYFHRTLDGGALPSFGHDLDLQRRSIERLRALRDGGAIIIPGHDLDTLQRLPRHIG